MAACAAFIIGVLLLILTRFCCPDPEAAPARTLLPLIKLMGAMVALPGGILGPIGDPLFIVALVRSTYCRVREVLATEGVPYARPADF